jgi:hypothetical protein
VAEDYICKNYSAEYHLKKIAPIQVDLAIRCPTPIVVFTTFVFILIIIVVIITVG